MARSKSAQRWNCWSTEREDEMRYVCLVYLADNLFTEQLSESDIKGLEREAEDYDAELVADGHMIAAAGLKPVSAATIVRKRNGTISAVDGPFAETKEQLAGLIMINARDLNEAIRIGGNIPLARHGTIEVRPVHEFA
jgi:hypothetical protein